MSDEFGVVGLGQMGGGLARQAIERGLRVSGFARSGAPADLIELGLWPADSLEALIHSLRPPRVVLLYIPAGKAVDDVIAACEGVLQPGDVLADGGNSYWGDSMRRAERLEGRGIHFVDLGTSGGVDGARSGACFMAGGRDEAIARIAPILTRLAVPGGFVHAGAPGTGHFTKLVHNGIEFGMLQAIGEGVALLEAFRAQRSEIPIGAVLETWRHGSVIRSWLVDLMAEAYARNDGMGRVPGVVEDTGEVNWLVRDAMDLEVPTPAIMQAVSQLFSSRDDEKNWARAIALMRQGFGGHPLGRSESIAKERRTSRVGDPP